MESDEDLRAALDLVDLDHSRQTKFLEGALAGTNAVRGWGITVWGALFALAFSAREPALCIGAAISIVAFAFADQYQSGLVEGASKHLERLEFVTNGYFEYLLADRSPEARELIVRRLERAQLGIPVGPFKMSVRRLRRARPRVFFRVVYPVLFLVAIGAFIVLVA